MAVERGFQKTPPGLSCLRELHDTQAAAKLS
jgi:hypothetical protein